MGTLTPRGFGLTGFRASMERRSGLHPAQPRADGGDPYAQCRSAGRRRRSGSPASRAATAANFGEAGGGRLSAQLQLARRSGRHGSSRPGGAAIGGLKGVAEKPPGGRQIELTAVGERELPLRHRSAAEVRGRSKKYPRHRALWRSTPAPARRRPPRGYLLQQWLADQGYIVVASTGAGRPAAAANGNGPSSAT